MYLSKFTDYSFRALIFLAKDTEDMYTVEEISKKLNVSESHMKKVIHNLAKNGYILSIKGRNGGLKLAYSPDNINLFDILVISEKLNEVVECFKSENSCIYIKENCKLKSIINSSIKKFSDEFKNYTLKDIL